MLRYHIVGLEGCHWTGEEGRGEKCAPFTGLTCPPLTVAQLQVDFFDYDIRSNKWSQLPPQEGGPPPVYDHQVLGVGVGADHRPPGWGGRRELGVGCVVVVPSLPPFAL